MGEILQFPVREVETHEEEKAQSFNILASVYLYRHDLQTFGDIRQETRQRVYNEELTFIAEGINRPLRTEFVIPSQNNQLVYFDKGEWQPYRLMLAKGLQAAQHEATADSRLDFMVTRAERDLQIHYEFSRLQANRTLAWSSSFPDEANYQAGGRELLIEKGYQPDRRMGFLYHATKLADGSQLLHTQSVDNSDAEAFAAAERAGNRPEATIDDMRAAYDQTLASKHHYNFYAGRPYEEDIHQNAWDVLRQHGDLLDYLFERIEAIAAYEVGTQAEFETQKNQLTYKVWATIKDRLDQQAMFGSYRRPLNETMFMQEIDTAYWQANVRHERLIGCGGSFGADTLLNESPETAFNSIFGKSTAENYKFDKEMYCVVCQAPPKKKDEPKWCGPCGICKDCDNKFKKKSIAS